MATTVLEMMLANNLTANATVLTQICFQAASQNNFSMCKSLDLANRRVANVNGAYGKWLNRRNAQGRKRVIQPRFNVSVPRAHVSKSAPTLRERSER